MWNCMSQKESLEKYCRKERRNKMNRKNQNISVHLHVVTNKKSSTSFLNNSIFIHQFIKTAKLTRTSDWNWFISNLLFLFNSIFRYRFKKVLKFTILHGMFKFELSLVFKFQTVKKTSQALHLGTNLLSDHSRSCGMATDLYLTRHLAPGTRVAETQRTAVITAGAL